MQIYIVSPLLACSSLVLGNFYERRYEQFRSCSPDPENTFKSMDEVFIYDLLQWVMNSDRQTQYFQGYQFVDFAFATASTKASQSTTEGILERLGFNSSIRVDKKKNLGNACKFWVIDVPFLWMQITKIVLGNPTAFGKDNVEFVKRYKTHQKVSVKALEAA